MMVSDSAPGFLPAITRIVTWAPMNFQLVLVIKDLHWSQQTTIFIGVKGPFKHSYIFFFNDVDCQFLTPVHQFSWKDPVSLRTAQPNPDHGNYSIKISIKRRELPGDETSSCDF